MSYGHLSEVCGSWCRSGGKTPRVVCFHSWGRLYLI